MAPRFHATCSQDPPRSYVHISNLITLILIFSIICVVKRCYIGIEITLASDPTFWDNCHAFSIAYPILASSSGQAFLKQCKEARKEVYTWTLNRQEEWVESAGWGVNVVMTDKPLEYLAFRKQMEGAARLSFWHGPLVLWMLMAC